MTDSDYYISLDDTLDAKTLFTSLLGFFSAFDVILNTWGKLPLTVHERLSSFRAACSRFRRILFHEAAWHLNDKSVRLLTECFCDDSVFDGLRWGVMKNKTSLAICHAWDDILVFGSDLISEAKLLYWIQTLKANDIIGSYEKTVYHADE